MAKKNDVSFIWGTGRRKTAIARVRITAGSGKIVVNKKEFDAYFTTAIERLQVVAPLKATESTGDFDVFVNAHGGGYAAQADAISLGIARALLKSNPDYETALRDGKFLTRDAREVERKKPGQKGARKSFQFSKR
jgi:small subunit ribosomal protein S9